MKAHAGKKTISELILRESPSIDTKFEEHMLDAAQFQPNRKIKESAHEHGKREVEMLYTESET